MLGLWRVLVQVGIAVGAVVAALLAWTVARHRRPRRHPTAELPPQVRANVPLEVLYTAVPLALVALLFALTIRTGWRVERVAAAELAVDVTGFQWGWRFRYPAQGVTLLGDSNRPPTLVLPLGATTRLRLGSPDVIHSFSVPAFLVKQDVVPGLDNELEVTPTRAGRFGGYCAEFCGLDHGRMTFTVEVLPPSEFQQWVAQQQEQQAREPDGRTGPRGEGGGDRSGQTLARPRREGTA